MVINNKQTLNDLNIYESNCKPQLFESLDHDSLSAILDNAIIQNHDSGRLLLQQGDEPEYLYLIIKGSIKTSRTDENGNEAVIRLLNKGETCMEAVIFMGGLSPINVQVIDDAQLLMIPAKFVKSHVLADTQFATNIIKIVTRHYKSALHQIDGMSIKSPTQRVGYYLLEKHLENSHSSLTFELPFKKATIASHLGMTPETFSRTLSKIKKMGINVQGDTIKLEDSFSLCHFCDTDLEHICSNTNKDDCPNCPINHKSGNNG
ncbi:MAG: Crp/Fnr family transcriptional regulator [Alphaproteobacteria bacterium]